MSDNEKTAKRDDPGQAGGARSAPGKRTDSTPGMAFERPILEMEEKLRELEELAKGTKFDISSEVESWRAKVRQALETTYADLSAWDQVNVARHVERPVTSDYLEHVFDDFIELHGDRAYRDDKAIVTGFATLRGRRVMVVGHRKGKSTKARLECNFGSAHPEGYRKALRKMRLADKLGLPIVTLINTPGAYPGIGAEERGQATAIAESIIGMFQLRTPIVATIIGEGGSGGALGIGVGDLVLMMEHSIYSVISPEGCAAILWKDGARTPDAAESLRLTARDLSRLGLIDRVIKEPLGGAHREPEVIYKNLGDALCEALDELAPLSGDEIVARRRTKYRYLGAIEGRFPTVV